MYRVPEEPGLQRNQPCLEKPEGGGGTDYAKAPGFLYIYRYSQGLFLFSYILTIILFEQTTDETRETCMLILSLIFPYLMAFLFLLQNAV